MPDPEHAGRSALLRARQSAELSREEVGRLLWPPVTGRTVGRWEMGRVMIEPWRLRQLAHVYRVPVADLTRLTPNVSPESPVGG